MAGSIYRERIRVRGTQTDDEAAAGYVGEEISAQLVLASGNGLATTVVENITSIELTPGDWDVSGQVWFDPAATTNITILLGAVSLVSATVDSENRFTQWVQAAAVPGTSNICLVITTTRISVAVTTTVYLVAGAVFTVSTLAGAGSIRARRVR